MNDLRKAFISGVIYTGVAKYAGIFVSIIVTAILARLIDSEDFGIVAIATVFINFFSILTTVGVTPAIIQNKKLTQKDIENINSFTVIIAVGLTILYICFVPFITKLYNQNEQLRIILYLLSFNILFSIISIVPNALIYKNKLFEFLAIRTFSIQCVLGIISVTCAYGGLGIYALVINPIGSSFFLLMVSFIKYPIPMSLRFNINSVKKILYFTSYQTLFNFIYLLYRNVDQIFVGKNFGLSTLGYYEKSYRLMMLPLDNISSVLSPILHPLLSEYQTEYLKIWNINKNMILFLSEFSILISVYLFFAASPIIKILYGNQWEASIPIFQILSLSIWAQMLQSPVGPILQSLNKVKYLTIGGCWILLFVLLSIACSWMLQNLNVLYVGIVSSFVLGFFVFQIYISRVVGFSVFEILHLLMPHFIVAAILFLMFELICIFIRVNNIWHELIMYTVLLFAYALVLIRIGLMPNVKNIVIKIISKTCNKILCR